MNNFVGVFSFSKECFTPGLAFAAAHPQTEFTINTAVSQLGTCVLTSEESFNSTKPTEVKSSLIGFTSSAGYISFYFTSKIINND